MIAHLELFNKNIFCNILVTHCLVHKFAITTLLFFDSYHERFLPYNFNNGGNGWIVVVSA